MLRLAHWLLVLGSTLTAACSESNRSTTEDAVTTTTSRDDYPLHTWMKANATPALGSGNSAQLTRTFERIEGFAPPGYTDWREIANGGARAATAGDIEGCRAACKSCHHAHRARYRLELRSRSLLSTKKDPNP